MSAVTKLAKTLGATAKSPSGVTPPLFELYDANKFIQGKKAKKLANTEYREGIMVIMTLNSSCSLRSRGPIPFSKQQLKES